MHPLAKLDHRYVWHPFTQMRDWLKDEPRVIVSAKGALLRDGRGREYLDANSSIWTNLHGHNHPQLNAAIQRQLRKIAHSSALGLANEPASLLAEQLVRAANPPCQEGGSTNPAARTKQERTPKLQKAFFSDDGSTAMEVALKLAYEFARRTGCSERPRFLSLESAYHGDTLGAVSLGHIDLFHKRFSGLLFKTDQVMAPYCYRCRFNRARPERADARVYRKCHWECLDVLERKLAQAKKRGAPYAAFVFEPLIQGAAGMIPQPPGWLAAATHLARNHGALLIADEVMTGFGRAGFSPAGTGLLPATLAPTCIRSRIPPQGQAPSHAPHTLFACQKESVHPDFMALAKGLTGGYLPMAATLTTQPVFDAFLADYAEFKTFFHGHSFTGNQLGAAAALANLRLLNRTTCVRSARKLENVLRDALPRLWRHPQVGDIRQVGLVAGIELVKNWRSRESPDLRERIGIRVCEAMARQGVLTRPIGNVIVLMPPLCTSADQVQQMVDSLDKALK